MLKYINDMLIFTLSCSPSFVDHVGEAKRQTIVDSRHQHALDRQEICRQALEH